MKPIGLIEVPFSPEEFTGKYLAIKRGVLVWPVKTKLAGFAAPRLASWHPEKEVMTKQSLIRGIDIELYFVPMLNAFRRFTPPSAWVLAVFTVPRMAGTIVGCITSRSNLIHRLTLEVPPDK